MIKQRQFICVLLMVIAILAINIIGVTGCAQQNPFIPAYIPPPNQYYIELTPMQIEEAMLSNYSEPASIKEEWEGRTLIIKNLTVDEYTLSTLKEDHINFVNIRCIPLRPADLSELKKGDVVDIIGVFADMPLLGGSNLGFIVLANCQFLRADTYPLPLPGEPASPIGGY